MAMKKTTTAPKKTTAAPAKNEEHIVGREELTSLVADALTLSQPELKLSKKNISIILKTAEVVILNAVKNDEKVRLLKFGTFEKKCTPERMGHNPSNGKPMKISAKQKLIFRTHVEY